MKYRKKPVVVEAWQWNGEGHDAWPAWMQETRHWIEGFYGEHPILHLRDGVYGDTSARKGDWIVNDTTTGAHTPMSPEAFAKAYEPILDPSAEEHEQIQQIDRSAGRAYRDGGW